MTYRLRLRNRILGIATAATVGMVALAGCTPSSTGDGDAPAGGELRAITVATLPTANLAAIHIGLDQGFFEDEGLDVTTQDVQTGSEMITGALGGTFDFFCVGYVPVFTAVSQGLPIRLIAGNDVGGATADVDWQITVAGADSPVQSVEDLATATIAVNALKGVAEIAVRASLQAQGIDDSGIKLTEIPFPEMPAALAQGTVDAAYMPEPFVTGVLAAGGRVADTPYAVLGDAFPNGAWGTTQQVIETDPELVAAFTRAITRSLEFAAENPDAVREIIPTYTQVPAETAAVIRLPVFTAELDDALMEELLGYTEKYGVIEDAVSLEELVYRP